ncbi:hypothetical protein [Streptomyces sp. SP18BB07]|uniref:hypothetical protein n=1 Tax=Streptomyces sp. SP18BB07 TaxID=3002522 RepID=UPI002E76B5BE|nr:hypothetical protein [Streptomyces sp. SP18BB07]MEE1765218.1 hypothetical protein [Streptomyces sp. SP18BB07]
MTAFDGGDAGADILRLLVPGLRTSYICGDSHHELLSGVPETGFVEGADLVMEGGTIATLRTGELTSS